MRKLLPKRTIVVLVAFSVLFLAACRGQDPAQKTLLLWHDWPAADAAVLNRSLEKFENLNPEINVVAQYVPEGDFVARYIAQVNLGFGPELILTNPANLQTLYERGFVRGDLREQGLSSEDIYSPALAAYADGEKLFGLPLSKST